MSLAATKDEKLLRAFGKGRHDAFEELVRRYGGPIKGYALRLLRNAELAEEVYVDTFERVARFGAKKWDQRGTVKSWLFTIAHNRCIDLLRAQRRAHDANPDVVALERTRYFTPNPEAEAALGELTEHLETAIQSLSDDHRQVLLLRTIHGLSSKEVAEIVGLDESQVRSQLSYARKCLRAELKRFIEPQPQRKQGGR